MNEGEAPGALRLLLAALIVGGVLLLGVLLVVFGYYVGPILVVVGLAAILVRWIRGGTDAPPTRGT